MKSEKEVREAFLQLMNERCAIETEMTKKEDYQNNLLQYNNLQAKHAAICIEVRILQWVLSD